MGRLPVVSPPPARGADQAYLPSIADSRPLLTVEFTAVYRDVPEEFIAFVEEPPVAKSQGATRQEARENLREAVALVLEIDRARTEEDLAGATVNREAFRRPA